MLATAPDAALTSATNNWGVYYTYAIAQAMRGPEGCHQLGRRL